MENKNLTINISTGTVFKIVGILVALAFIYFIRDIILMVFISVIFAAIIEPLVNYLEGKKIPRGIGVLIIYVVLFLFIILLVRMIIPPIAEQVSLLTRSFPDLWSKIIENVEGIRQYSEQQGLTNNIQKGLQTLQSGLETAAGGVYSFIVSIFRSVVNFLLVLAIIFYLVVERGAVGKLFKSLAPAQYHSYLVDLFARIQVKIGAWARAQLILGLIIGFLSFIGLLIFLPKYALVLALIAGVTEVIPYLGPIMGAVPAVFLGFAVPPFSFARGLAILILYIVIQQMEEKIIVPKVMQTQVGLNPLVTIIIMLLGFRLAGIIGLIIAVPVATAIGVVVKDFIANSDLPEIKAKLDGTSGKK